MDRLCAGCLALFSLLAAICVTEASVKCLVSANSNETIRCSTNCSASWSAGENGDKIGIQLGCYKGAPAECPRKCMAGDHGPNKFACCCSKKNCNLPSLLKPAKIKDDGMLKCHAYRDPNQGPRESAGLENDIYSSDGRYQMCPKNYTRPGMAKPYQAQCYTVFENATVVNRGCLYPGNTEKGPHCLPPRELNRTMCYCGTHTCNHLSFNESAGLIEWPEATTGSQDSLSPTTTPQSPHADVYVGVAVAAVIIAAAVSIVVFACHRHKRSKLIKLRKLRELTELTGGVPQTCLTPSGDRMLRLGGPGGDGSTGGIPVATTGVDLFPEKQIHKGRFGEVWLANWMNGGSKDDSKITGKSTMVCTKYFGTGQKELFLNEWAVYALPLVADHVGVVRCMAAEAVCGSGDSPGAQPVERYALVFEYHSHGALLNYLKGHEVTWRQLCIMARSIADGLSFLHGESYSYGLPKGHRKPPIVHRDLNSRNILVKSDLTCAIADMGFAMKMDRQTTSAVEENQERSLRDVGTIRYMAPEVLEGAVNLRDCEISLKQIDVYALSLVFWEVSSRCSELYTLGEAVSYKLPFEDEVGTGPTFAAMQNCVSRNKSRPKFSKDWVDNQVVRNWKEMLQDCWDSDGEARLTALCVKGRIKDLEQYDCSGKALQLTVPSMLDNDIDGPPDMGSCVGLRPTYEDGDTEEAPLCRYRPMPQSISVSGVTTLTHLSASPSCDLSTPPVLRGGELEASGSESTESGVGSGQDEELKEEEEEGEAATQALLGN